MTAPTVWEHGLALIYGAVIPVAGAFQHLRRRMEPVDPEALATRQRVALYWINSLVLIALAVAALAASLHAGRTPSELGLTAPPARPLSAAFLVILFGALYWIDTWRQLASPDRLAETRARWRRNTPFMPSTGREVAHSLVLVVSAAVCEEIVYRGFLIGHLVRMLGETPAGVASAVAIPALIFALCHYYQGARAVAKIALLAIIFGIIFIVTGSLWIPIALHFLVDLVGALLGPRLLAPEPGSADPGAARQGA